MSDFEVCQVGQIARLQTALAVAESFHRVAVAERNQERATVAQLRAELSERTAAVIVSDGGQALACSESVAAAYRTLKAEVDRRFGIQGELVAARAERDALRELLRRVLSCGLNEEPHGVGFTPSRQEKKAGELARDIEAALGKGNKDE